MRKTHRPLTQTDVAKILLGLVVIILIIFAYLFIPRTKEVIKSFKHKKVIVKDSVTVKDVTITLYQPTAKQCGNNKNITANGEHGHIGTCAASLCMFEYNVNMGDTVVILDGSLRGKYRVNDLSNSKLFAIDVWQPCNSKKRDCYSTNIKIIH